MQSLAIPFYPYLSIYLYYLLICSARFNFAIYSRELTVNKDKYINKQKTNLFLTARPSLSRTLSPPLLLFLLLLLFLFLTPILLYLSITSFSYLSLYLLHQLFRSIFPVHFLNLQVIVIIVTAALTGFSLSFSLVLSLTPYNLSVSIYLSTSLSIDRSIDLLYNGLKTILVKRTAYSLI